MAINNNKKFIKTRVKLDNNEFIGCHFEDSVVEYSGEGPVKLENNAFVRVKWELTGAAQLTLIFLSGLYHGMGEGGKELVEKTFESIKAGNNQ